MSEPLKIVTDTTRDPNSYLTKTALKEFLGGVSKSSINYWRKTKGFPAPRYVSPTLPLWKVQDVIDWVESIPKRPESPANEIIRADI